MGLFDKITAAFAGSMPDYIAEITAVHGDAADAPLAFAKATPAAYTRGGAAGTLTVEGALFSGALAAAQNAFAGSKHVDGDVDSIARTLTKDGDLQVLSLGATHATWWDFGMTATDTPPTLTQQVPRASFASIVDTGKRAQGGQQIARFTFTDGSSFDYRLLQPSPTFWEVAASYPQAT